MTAPLDDIRRELVAMRMRLDSAFGPETALRSKTPGVPSAGHCAAVAAIVQARFGGNFVSANVEGESHWFNRIRIGSQELDVDLTGDQFGKYPVQIAPANTLYVGTRLRQAVELNDETRLRSALLASRAGVTNTVNTPLPAT